MTLEMKLKTEFFRLPLYFDADRLKGDLAKFSEDDWKSHSTEIPGIASIPLVSVGGTFNNDFAIAGVMAATPFLDRCTYLHQVLRALGLPLSRCRLSRLASGVETSAQVNQSYHWFRRIPLYIPVLTESSVKLVCNGKEVHMQAGEVWAFQHVHRHFMANCSPEACIHLVVEVRSCARLEQLLQHSYEPMGLIAGEDSGPLNSDPVISGLMSHLADDQDQLSLPLEPYCFEVLTADEVEGLVATIAQDLHTNELPEDICAQLVQDLEQFQVQWRQAFVRFGHGYAGELTYWELILRFKEQVVARANRWLPHSGQGRQAIGVITSMLTRSARPILKKTKPRFLARKTSSNPAESHFSLDLPGSIQIPRFDRPIFIVSAPRAGSTLLFETLAQFSDVWTIGEESHDVIEGMPELHPSAHNFSSNRLSKSDAAPPVIATLKARFTQQLQDNEGHGYLDLPPDQRPASLRFLEKTPRNALRIPFLRAAFPDALFVYLYRDPKDNISSMIEGWRSRRFVSYRQLQGWHFREWSFLLPPQWHSLQDCSIAEIAAYQWKSANAYILDDLCSGPEQSWCLVHFCDLIQQPRQTIEKISDFAGLQWNQHIEQRVSQSLPISKMAVSAPSPDKWRKHEQELASVLPNLTPLIRALEEIQ